MQLSDFVSFGLIIEENVEFDCFAKVSDKISGQALSFLENDKFFDKLANNKNIVAVITTAEYKEKCLDLHIGVAISNNPKLTFINIHNNIAKTCVYIPTAIKESAIISAKADISNLGVSIGNNSIVEEYVKIYPGVIIGDNCIIKRGSILGSHNMERCRDENGHYIDSIHVGNLMIRNNVRIEEDVRIDKALFHWDSTVIDDDCFIGRGSDIGHGCKIGRATTLTTNVIVCGNVDIGKNVRIGSGAIISNRLSIGDESLITLGSVVTKNVSISQHISGNFGIPHNQFIRFIKSIS